MAAEISCVEPAGIHNHDVRFGTSGLRGRAEAFTPDLCRAYVSGFLDVARTAQSRSDVFVAADRRASSSHIVGLVSASIKAAGLQPIYLGVLPTPALADYSFARNSLSIMVTGSHIPADYNGLKFYRHDGELTKEDEPAILARVHAFRGPGVYTADLAPFGASDDPALCYIERYTGVFPSNLLKGLRLGIDLHSGAGTDLVARTLEGLGAIIRCFGKTKDFVAVDTEALSPERLALYRSVLRADRLDGVVSADGDGDRPLLIDATGEQVAGDTLGIMAAKYLEIDHVVTPVTSTSAIEATGWFSSVARTKVGSPYVIAAMGKLRGKVAGFEANGGFILGSDIDWDGRPLRKLVTRDAMLPLITALATALRHGSIASAVGALPRRVKLSDRICDIMPEQAYQLLDGLAQSANVRNAVEPRMADPLEIDLRDGVRLICRDAAVVHFRQSGNAPEFRCYVEAATREESRDLLEKIIRALTKYFEASDPSLSANE